MMQSSTKINANAYVLIGGSSKRFGSPKWKAKLNGVRLIDHTWEICKIFDNCTIVGKSKNNENIFSFLTIKWISWKASVRCFLKIIIYLFHIKLHELFLQTSFGFVDARHSLL